MKNKEVRYAIPMDVAFNRADKIIRLLLKKCKGFPEAFLTLKIAEMILTEMAGLSKPIGIEEEQELRAFIKTGWKKSRK